MILIMRSYWIDDKKVSSQEMLDFLKAKICPDETYRVGKFFYSVPEIIDMIEDEGRKKRIDTKLQEIKKDWIFDTLCEFFFALCKGLCYALFVIVGLCFLVPCAFAGPIGWFMIFSFCSMFNER